MLQQSVTDLRKIRYEVRATKLGQFYDPTGDVVRFAFSAMPADADPATPFSVVGAWETWGTASSTRYMATCLVGPGGSASPAKGEYRVWAEINDTPEIIRVPLGLLTIT